MRGLLLAVMLTACVSGGADEIERGVTGDGAVVGETLVDSAVLDTGVADAFVAPDTAAPDTSDTSMPAPDTAACKTTCKGEVECGKIPDGCGGYKDCGDCGEPGVYCESIAPLHQPAVRAAIETTKMTNPEYFDFADTLGGESVKVVKPTEFRAKVVSEVNAKAGKVCIADPNDSREIRVRASTSMAAENYLTITSGGYSAYKYTSTCTPAGF